MAVWGIKVEPREQPHYLAGQISVASFVFRFAQGNPRGRLFFSSKELANFVEENSWLKGKQLGKIKYLVYPKPNKVAINEYKPFEEIVPFKTDRKAMEKAMELLPRRKRKAAKFLLGRGIASHLERACVRHLCKKHPKATYVGAAVQTGFRKAQLRKRGLRPGHQMLLREYWKIMLQATRKWRQRKRRP